MTKAEQVKILLKLLKNTTCVEITGLTCKDCPMCYLPKKRMCSAGENIFKHDVKMKIDSILAEFSVKDWLEL